MAEAPGRNHHSSAVCLLAKRAGSEDILRPVKRDSIVRCTDSDCPLDVVPGFCGPCRDQGERLLVAMARRTSPPPRSQDLDGSRRRHFQCTLQIVKRDISEHAQRRYSWATIHYVKSNHPLLAPYDRWHQPDMTVTLPRLAECAHVVASRFRQDAGLVL